MDLLWNSKVVLVIIVLIKTAISKEIRLDYENLKAPLVMKEDRDKTLSLATPERYDTISSAHYYYDDSEDERGRTENIVVACPVSNRSAKQLLVEDVLKRDKKLSEDSKLLIADEYTHMGGSLCDTELVPSIEKSKKKDDTDYVEYCDRQVDAEIYNVGYPVIKKMDNQDYQEDVTFVTIYQICYSRATYKLHTIHRIVSPKIALHRLWEFYQLNPEVSLQTFPHHRTSITTKSIYKKHYAYQFVGFEYMPTRSWDRATLFSINYTLITKNQAIMKGMITVDNYIRLYSKETDKPLTLYSGSYQITISLPPLSPCLTPICSPKQTDIKTFWRLVIDEANHAVIIATQHTQMKCDKTYICEEKEVVVKKYEKGGCTYTCPVDDELLQKLDLPELTIIGYLTLTFPQKIPGEAAESLQDEEQQSVVESPKDISIFDFMGEESFMSVLRKVDPELARSVLLDSITDVIK